jgi:hypothetical protein
MVVVVQNYSTDYYCIVLVVGFRIAILCSYSSDLHAEDGANCMSTSILCLGGTISTRLVIITTGFKYATGITKSFCSTTCFQNPFCPPNPLL